MIDLERLEKIIDETIDPANKAEEIFKASYEAAYNGELLVSLCIEYSKYIDSPGSSIKDHLIVGYAWGQKDSLEEILTVVEGDDTNVH